MLAFLLAHWLAIVIVGIVLNVLTVCMGPDTSTSGGENAMAQALAFCLCPIPYLIFVFWLADKLGILPR